MTTQPTRDQVPLEVTQLQGLIPNDALPAENQKGNKKLEGPEEIMLLVSPFQNYPNLNIHIIEATTKVSEHGEFKVGGVLLTEHIEERRIIHLPENGMHNCTPFNMHLTSFYSQDSSIGLQPLQKQEQPANVHYRKTIHFFAQFNINSSKLNVDTTIMEARSLFGSDIPSRPRGLRPIVGLNTANFGDPNDPNPLINMNDVFAAQDESGN